MNPADRNDQSGALGLDIRPPEEEFRTLVRARMETLAKLGAAGGASPSRLDLYAEVLDRGLAHLKEARPR